MKKSKPKRFIEIYFVLYLAALILLIPDKKHEDRQATQLISSLLQSGFTLQTEHSVLLCRVVRNGDSTSVIACDSLNTIYHSGSVSNVTYDVSIEDQSYKNSLVLNSNSATSASYFRLSGHTEEGSIRFQWSPPVLERRNRLFRVTVRATASPVLPVTLTDEQQTYIREVTAVDGELKLHAETQFTVALIYVDGGSNASFATALSQQSLLPSDTAFQQRYEQLLRQLETSRTAQPPPGEFLLQPRETILKMIAYQPFENRIRVYGADPQRELESIHVSGSNAYVKTEGNELVVYGTTPPTGNNMYTVTARRSRDKRDTSVSFRVIARNLDAPIVPLRMYPGVSYTFNPNLPELSGSPAGASLRDERNNEVLSSVQGESFSFRPVIDDTAHNYSFERTLNGRKIGQTLSIPVLPFPAPEIIDISMRNGLVWVRTRSYGLQSDSKARVKLELTAGTSSLKIQERLGDWTYDEKVNAHLQVFQFSSNSSSLTVRAVNGYKKSSERRDFVVRE